MPNALNTDARALAPRLTEWRRDLHRHPELGFCEQRTSALVRSELEALGIEAHSGVGRTGVVGVLRAPRARRGAVLLRADMDALPIQEASAHAYRSTRDGAMHACGHDGHTSMLLGAARLLSARHDDLPGDVILCFQPAEELVGGALAMLGDGLLERWPATAAYGLHLWSQLPVGGVYTRPGPLMASADAFTVSVEGRGGHGAMPHATADPIVAAAHAIVALQSIVSRSIDPLEPAVVTIGSIQAGTACNVIPDAASLTGTIRAFAPEVRETLRRRVAEVVAATAQAHGCRGEVTITEGGPAVINDAGAATLALREAAAVVGETNVFEMVPMMGGEDFAYILNRLPGAFVFVGAGNAARGITHPHHSPLFDIDEAALPIGAELLARIALAND